MTIAYEVKGNLYINITNRCPCACVFCVRQSGDGVYGSDSLWLPREPEIGEITAAIDGFDLRRYGEVVFCGYGEPMERADDVAFLGRRIKENGGIGEEPIKVRLNTNGLGDKINERPTAALLSGAVDVVSVSLNAGNRERYLELTRPLWEDSFEAMLKFAEDCKRCVPAVIFTVVDVLPPDELRQAKAISENMGIPLRVRGLD
jgi:radical SAM enzyme (TIGR04100 family)